MGTHDKPLPGTTNADDLLPWDDEDEALAQGVSATAVSDAYDQGVAAGRLAERNKIAAWLHAQSTIQAREAFLNGGPNEALVAKVVTLIADTIKRTAQAIQEGKHAISKTESTE